MERPRAVRDSEGIQVTTPGRHGTNPSRKPPRQAGQKCPTFGHRGGGALEGTLASLNLVENIRNRRGSRREVGGAEAGNREGDQGLGQDIQGQGAAEREGGLASLTQERPK